MGNKVDHTDNICQLNRGKIRADDRGEGIFYGGEGRASPKGYPANSRGGHVLGPERDKMGDAKDIISVKRRIQPRRRFGKPETGKVRLGAQPNARNRVRGRFVVRSQANSSFGGTAKRTE